MSEKFTVYGTAASARKWAPGIALAHRDTKEEAEQAVRDIRWRGKSKPTRIVRQTTGHPPVVLEEWRL